MMTSLSEIARALGGEIVGGQVLAPGPGHSRKDRSLSVKMSPTAPDGFLALSHAADDWRDCRDYVRERLGIDPDSWKAPPRATAGPRLPPPRAEQRNDHAEKTAAAMSLWRASVDPRGTIVERCLASRGLTLDEDIAGEVLRWHPGISAVALFRDIRTDEPKSISRTFVDSEGRKLSRKFLGPVGGCAIKLDADENVLGGLHIGEGVETVLTARMLGLTAR
jgi:putative DNA primase/helicase